MKVEILIYVYMFICVSLMVFNTFYIIIMKRVNRSIDKNTDRYTEEIINQISRIHNGCDISEKHKNFLYKKLKNISHLTAFDKSLEEIYKSRCEEAEKYLLEIYPVFMYLSCEYEKKDSIKSAYLPYIISKYNLLKAKNSTFILDNIIELLHSPNVYCRENALKAIYSMGNSKYVIKALKIIDTGDNFHHSKLICDGLMTFNGNKEELALKLWNEFENFSVKRQLDILNFIRFTGIQNDERILSMLENEKEHKEIRLSCIRYFEKFYYSKAEKFLHKLAKNEDEYDWEYQAIASSALKNYSGAVTEEILKANLSSHNWYVRYNSAESCDRLGLTYSDLIGIFNGEDRYAREMAQYRFDRKAAQKEVVFN